MLHNRRPDQERKIIDWIIAGLGVLLALLLFVLLLQYESLRRDEAIRARTAWFVSALRDRTGSAAASAATIQTWMTFDYLNRAFGLPPAYLKERLSVTDPRYPKLTIGELAEDEHAAASSTLGAVRAAVEAYLSAPLPVASST